jgi:TrbC/VIRB2 family.
MHEIKLKEVNDAALWLIGLSLLMLPLTAIAQEAALPYEGGLRALYGSLTGTVPFIISLVGIVACGALLIFGGEISGFMRTLVFIVLVIAIIVQAAALITAVTGQRDPFDVSSASSASGLRRDAA